jgi:hypothetical protein
VIIRMFCTEAGMWNVSVGPKGEAYRYGRQVLDFVWQRLGWGGGWWDVWMEGTSINLSDQRLESVPADEFLARVLTRREAYDFIQPHIMMLGPL